MATKTSSATRRTLSASIQWVALIVFVLLAILAAFVYFGEDSTGGTGHSGAPAASSVQ